MLKAVISIPLTLYLLVAFNVVVMLDSSKNSLDILNTPFFAFSVPSSATIVLTTSSVFIITGIVFLYFEILKATRASKFAVLDHGLSLLVFVIFLVEFIAVDRMGNSTFLILTLLTLVDVIAGFTVSISAARRDISLS